MQDISRENLWKEIDQNKDFVLLETLMKKDYDEFHLPRAENLPLSINFEEKADELIPSKDKKVVVYCRNPSCKASEKAAEKLEGLGFTNVFRFEGGKEGWKEAGYPVES